MLLLWEGRPRRDGVTAYQLIAAGARLPEKLVDTCRVRLSAPLVRGYWCNTLVLLHPTLLMMFATRLRLLVYWRPD